MKLDLKQGTFFVNLPVPLYERLDEVCRQEEKLDKQFCGFLFHLIITYDNYNNSEYIEEGWAFLPSSFLRRFNHGGLKYNEQRDLLVQYRLIELLTHLNFPGVSRCTGYRIKEDFLYDPNRIPEENGIRSFHTSILIDRKHIAKILGNYNKQYCLEADNSTGHLTKWLRPENLVIDRESAIRYIKGAYNSPEQKFQFTKRLNAINNFGQFDNYRRRGKDNRLHSYFTRFPNDLKPFVRHASNKRLVEVDIKNSQPFIFTVLIDILERHIWNPKKDIKKKNNKESVDRTIIEIKNKINSNYRYPIRIRRKIEELTIISQNSSGDFDYKEIFSFRKNIRTQDFYQLFGDECLITGAIKKIGRNYETNLFDKDFGYIRKMQFKSTRDCAKQIIINALYARGRGNTSGLKFFRQKYPSVSKLLDAFKKKDPTLLPILMQRIEAKCVLDYCTKKISKKYPNMFLLTCHDSITTTEDRADELYDAFRKYLIEFFGVPVRIARKNWNSY